LAPQCPNLTSVIAVEMRQPPTLWVPRKIPSGPDGRTGIGSGGWATVAVMI
jgi:hypothetical protein